MSAKSIFITGTGTDVGKTYVTALIVKKLAEKASAGYFKAAMSGNERDVDGNLIPGDAVAVKTVAGISQGLGEMCPYVYENAYSPHLASRLEGNPVKLDVVTKKFGELSEKYDYLTMEGSGGILCPIYYEKSTEDNTEKIMLEDVIKSCKLDCILVADAGLGTINSVVLTYEYMKSKDILLKGIIFNRYHGTILEDDNIRMCKEMTGLPVIAKVGDDATDLGISFEELAIFYEE